MCLKQCIMVYTLATLGVYLGRAQLSAGAEEGKLSLKVDRATASTLMIEVPCKPYCKTTVSWQLKVDLTSEWVTSEDVLRHHAHEDTYVLRYLQPNTQYYIRALLKPLNIFTQVLEVSTCPVGPPPVASLHVAGAGAGWLEVRWAPPAKERCGSQLKYWVRYRAEGAPFSARHTHGTLLEDDRYLRFRPAHPCAPWPHLFCLLLTDYVQPGRNHTVEVQVVRLDTASSDDVSVAETTYGFATSSPYDETQSVTASEPCEGGAVSKDRVAPNPQEKHSPGGVQLPLWAAVAGWAAAAILSLMFLVMAAAGRACRGRQEVKENTVHLHRNEIVVPLTVELDVSLPSCMQNTGKIIT